MSKFWRYFASNGRGAMDCPRLGIKGYEAPIYPSLVHGFNLPNSDGVEVWGLDPNGAANKAGLREWDIIVSAGKSPTASMRDLVKLLGRSAAGQPIPLVLLRDEQIVEHMVVLPEKGPGRGQ